MSADAGPAGEERFALRGGRAVELHTSGFTHPTRRTQRFTPYVELIHVAVGARGLRIGAERGSIFLGRGAFAAPDAPRELAQRLRERMAALPDGARRTARQDALDRRIFRRTPPRVGLVLTLVCVALHALATFLPALPLAGEYWRLLGFSHEPWRLVTSQLLHSGVPHLAANSLGLFALGGLLERQIDAARTVLVAAAAAAGAMIGSSFAGYESVVGASGVVMGFAGALIALEVRRPDLLPAPLRLPRGLLIGAVLADFALLSFFPNVAHAAHGGGLVAGGATALALAPEDAEHLASGPLLRFASAGAGAVMVAALAALAWGLLDPGGAAARRGASFVDDASAPILLLNNDAWIIATSKAPTPDQLEIALQLALRAVGETGGEDPNLLDTLAEVYFQLGRKEEAVETIEQAIARAPGVSYFEEQRRRFTGERAPDDRPAPPDEPPPDPDEPSLDPELVDPDAPSIRV